MSAGRVAGLLKKHVLGENLVRRNPFYYDRTRKLLTRLESLDFDARLAFVDEQLGRTLALPRGKTPLIVHRPPVHDALRRQGVEPLFTR